MKIAILGYGVEGKAAEKYFQSHPYESVPPSELELTVFDHFSVDDLPDLSGFDLVFRTPSVNPHKIKSSRVTSITDYFFDHVDLDHIIGVTGTKGKGTTCSLTKALLESLGYRVFLVGNIGEPAINSLDILKSQPDENYFVVYEMSSFQLWSLQKSPHVSAVLRISPDHLDIHDDYEDYLSAKSNITSHQTAKDYCIYYAKNSDSEKVAHESPGTLIPYPTSNSKLNALLGHLQLPGAHNRENAEAALNLVAAALNLDLGTMIDTYHNQLTTALENFEGLPHRIQFVRELDGVKYYDDNYSSALPASEVAVKAFADHPVILIAGGKDRHLDYSAHQKLFFDSPNVKKVILIGELKEKLAENQDPSKYEFADALEEAVEQARAAAVKCSVEPFTSQNNSGVKASTKPFTAPIVLMSPGCASFDMFKNFGDRGDQFQRIVNDLQSTQENR